jgi:hypothetical protein
MGGAGKAIPSGEISTRAAKYLRQARHYELNARRLFRVRDDAKAGEAAWGAVVSALKALALLHHGRLLRASEATAFGRRVARELDLHDEFTSVQALHANLYD